MHLPTLRQIQFLLALRDTGGFNKAAFQCAVTQSTLSAGIQEMESILGAPVIDRARRGQVCFTPLGDMILVQGEAMIVGLAQIAERARRSHQPFAWPVRLGIIPTVAPFWLPRLLRPLQEAFPQLELHVTELQSAPLVDHVMSGALDCGIMAFPYDTKDLHTRDLHREDFRVAVPAGLFPGRTSVTLGEIDFDRLLLLADGHCLRDHTLAACRLKAPVGKQDLRAASLATLIQLVDQGYGVTLLPEMAARDATLPETLITLPIRPDPPIRRIGMVWRAKSAVTRDVDTLSAAISRILQNHPLADKSFT